MDKFCDKYIVDKKLVKDLQHLHHLEVKKIKKQQERQLRSQREDEVNYDAIDWQQYYNNKCLSKLKVKTLDKYLLHNRMEQYLSLLRKEKCQAVSHHIAFKNLQLAVFEKHNTVDDVDLSEAKNENDSCDDADDEEEEGTVFNFVDEETYESDTEPEQDGGTQEESFDDANMMEVAVSDLFVATRSGRIAKSWSCSYFCCK